MTNDSDLEERLRKLGKQARVDTDRSIYTAATFIPDGSKILISTKNKSSERILIHDLKNKKTTELTEGSGAEWYLGGREIVYINREHIFALDLSGNREITKLDRGEKNIIFCLDDYIIGSRMTNQILEVFKINNNGDLKVLANHAPIYEIYNISNISFSKAGTLLFNFFSSTDKLWENQKIGIDTRSTKKLDISNLLPIGISDSTYSKNERESIKSVNQFSLSPNESYLAGVTSYDIILFKKNYVKTGYSFKERLIHGEGLINGPLIWSPDEKILIYENLSQNYYNLGFLDVNSRKSKIKTPLAINANNHSDSLFSWHPDSTSFVKVVHQQSGGSSVILYDIKSRTSKVIYQSDDTISKVRWQPIK